MLPNEANTKKLIRQALGPHFSVLEHALVLSIEMHDQILQMTFPATEARVKYVLSGLLAQSLMRLRAVSLVCEHGLLHDAEVLLRSLYETRLAVRFVVRAPAAIDPNWSAQLRQAIGKFPKPPAGRTPVGFRADLYLCAPTLSRDKLAKHLASDPMFSNPKAAATIQTATARMPEVEKILGTKWIEHLGKNKLHYYGLPSVQLLAEYCGQADYHKKVYGFQSEKSHGGGALQYLVDQGVAPFATALEGGIALLLACLADFDSELKLQQKRGLKHVTERLADAIRKADRLLRTKGVAK